MRPIDADYYKDCIENWKEIFYYYHSPEEIEDIIFSTCIEFLDKMPTIDAEPKRHGRWIDNGRYDGYTMYICSECGHAESIQYNYCPDCGAKMDGDREDD